MVGVEAAGLRLVEAFYAALNSGDVAGVLRLASEDIVITQSDRLPWGGRFVGREGLARFAAGVRTVIASNVVVERVVAAGDRVAVSGWSAGAVVRTGRKFEAPLVHLFTVSEDKISALEVLVDVPAMRVVLA